MENIENKDEQKETKKEPVDNKKIITSILDGSFLTNNLFIKQMPFVFFLGFLSLIYITVRNQSEKTLINYTTVQREVRELRAESISIASELMFISKQSEVLKAVTEKNLGLVEATEPPKKILINND